MISLKSVLVTLELVVPHEIIMLLGSLVMLELVVPATYYIILLESSFTTLRPQVQQPLYISPYNTERQICHAVTSSSSGRTISLQITC